LSFASVILVICTLSLFDSRTGKLVIDYHHSSVTIYHKWMSQLWISCHLLVR